MNLNKTGQIILLSVLSLSIFPQEKKTENPADIIRFADFLTGEQDYYRAITEYRRAFFYLSDTETDRKDSINFKIGLCERKRGDFETAALIFEKTLKKSGKLSGASLKQLAYTHYLSGDFLKSLNIIGNSEEFDLKFLKGWNNIRLKQWQNAKSVFTGLKGRHIINQEEIKKLYNEFSKENLPGYKRPFISAFLSIVPGLGKIYCERYADGIYSFLINLMLGYAAYNADKNNKKTRFIVLGSISSVFYLGNIYGSYLAAKVVNRDNINNFIEKIEAKYHHHLLNLFDINF